MRTTATNKRLRELITEIGNNTLIPNPSFQRRLVWADKHKAAFIKTVLEELPFPEIYIAAGNVDLDTGEGQTMLVDGQQRITTLYEYFTASPNLKLPRSVKSYADLDDGEKRRFLDYDVVVRDLGQLQINDVIEVFNRINSTSYSLNAMEIANARYDNKLKDLAQEIALHPIFENHVVFSSNEIKRMQDDRFALGLIITVMSDYFNRDELFQDYLIRYNDEFEEYDVVKDQIFTTIGILDDCGFKSSSRVWKKADLFTALAEIHRMTFKFSLQMDIRRTAESLSKFYEAVDDITDLNFNSWAVGWYPKQPSIDEDDLKAYHSAAIQATNDRLSRVRRGDVIRKVLQAT